MATRSLLTKNFAPIAPDNTAPSSNNDNNAPSNQESMQISVAPYDVLDRILWDDDEQFMRVRGEKYSNSFCAHERAQLSNTFLDSKFSNVLYYTAVCIEANKILEQNHELERLPVAADSALKMYQAIPKNSLAIGQKILKDSKFTFNNLVTLGNAFKDKGEAYNIPIVNYNYLCTIILGAYALFHEGKLLNNKGQFLFDCIYKFHDLESMFLKVAPYYRHSFGFCLLKGLWHYMEGHDALALHYLRYSQYFYQVVIPASENIDRNHCQNRKGSSLEVAYDTPQWLGIPGNRFKALYELSFNLYHECLSSYATGTGLTYDSATIIAEYESQVLSAIKNCIKSRSKATNLYVKDNNPVRDPATIVALQKALNDWCSYFAFGASLELGPLDPSSFDGIISTGALKKPLDVYLRPQKGSFDAYQYSFSVRSSLGLLKLLATKFSAIINTKLKDNLTCHFDPNDFVDPQQQAEFSPLTISKAHNTAIKSQLAIQAERIGHTNDFQDILLSNALNYGYERFALGRKLKHSEDLPDYCSDEQIAYLFKHTLENDLIRYQCSSPNAMIGYEGCTEPIEEALHKSHISVKEFSFTNALRFNRCQNYLNCQRLIPTLDIEYINSFLFLKENVQDLQPFKLNCAQRSGVGLFYLALHSKLISAWDGKLANELIVKPLNELLQGTLTSSSPTQLNALAQKRHRTLKKLLPAALAASSAATTVSASVASTAMAPNTANSQGQSQAQQEIGKLEQSQTLANNEDKDYQELWAFNYGSMPQRNNSFSKEPFALGQLNGSHDQAASIIGISENSKDHLLCLDLLVFNYNDMVELIKLFLKDAYQDLKLDLAFIQAFYAGCAPTFLIYTKDDLNPNEQTHLIVKASDVSLEAKLEPSVQESTPSANNTKSTTRLSLRTKANTSTKEQSAASRANLSSDIGTSHIAATGLGSSKGSVKDASLGAGPDHSAGPDLKAGSMADATPDSGPTKTKLSLKRKKTKENTTSTATAQPSLPESSDVFDDDFFKNFEPIVADTASDDSGDDSSFNFDLGAMLKEMNSKDEH